MSSPIGALRRVWVSGASRGIGMGIARCILEGHSDSRVWASARGAAEAPSEGLQKLKEEFGDRVQVKSMDLCDPAQVAATAAAVADEAAGLDALVNTVGLLHRAAGAGGGRGKGPEKRLRDVDAAWALENFQVNAVGPMLLAQQVAERSLMAKDKWTVMANLSARVGSISDNKIGSWYSYRASKAAQNQLTRCFAIELARMKRSVVCVGLHPGTVDTQLSAPFSRNVSHEIFPVEKAAAQLVNVLQGIRPEEHNGLVLSYDGSAIPA